MAEKKFLTLPRLTEYDGLIKDYINTGLSGKSATSHTHDDKYYTESEIDSKLIAINSSIDKVTSGETVVSKATSATYASNASSATNASTAAYASNAANATNATSATNASTAAYATKAKNADTATYASSANTATSATSATNAGTATYANSAGTANKLGSSTVGSASKPVYIKDGVATTCTTYAGGTRITLNGTSKSGSSVAIFAPTTGGTAGYVLKSAGTASAPTWAELDAYTKTEVDNKLAGKSDTSHNHDTKYDAKGAASSALASAKEYADGIKNDLLNGAGEAYDTLSELGALIDDNQDAISALETIASGKANADHDHAIADVTGLQSALDEKAASSHGTHVTWSTTSPKMNGTASVGSETKVARGDHVHPTDTSRASQADLDALEDVVATKAASTHTHSNATTAAAGLMTAAMVTKLNGIAEGANKYTHPTTSGNKHIPSGGASGQFLKWSADGTAVWAADNNTTYSAGAGIGLSGTTFSNAGVRSVVTGSTNGTIIVNTNGTTASVPVKGLGAAAYLGMDTSLSTSSNNPVQNKAVASAINTATSAITANTNSISEHTTAISSLQTAVANIQEITSEDVANLFA